MEEIKSPPGVFDILPDEKSDLWRNAHFWHYVEGVIRRMAKLYGFHEIRTPLFEKTELFKRSVGEGTDIVSKEMYTFQDKGDRSLTLRPEGTAPVIRAFIEHQLAQQAPLHKLYYIAPMFRYERSQAGRYRQHHQFGVEIIGSSAPEQDAEMIDLAYSICSFLGLKNLSVVINSIGTAESRQTYRAALKDFLKSQFEQLSPDSKGRFETNPLRILDSKDPRDKEVIAKAPSILNFLDEESEAHFEIVKQCLDALEIPYQVNPFLVRGLDYYNKTVFEITSGELGAQNSIAGGGRYDGLIKSLGGPDLPSTGFAMGIERILQTMIGQNISIPPSSKSLLFLIPMGEEACKVCYKIQHDLRSQGLSVQMDYSGKKLNKAMQYANQLGVTFVAVVGDQELQSQEVELKNMATGEKLKAPLLHLGRILLVDAQSDQFLQLWNTLSKPFEDPAQTEFFLSKLSHNIKQTQHLTSSIQKAMLDILRLVQNENVD